MKLIVLDVENLFIVHLGKLKVRKILIAARSVKMKIIQKDCLKTIISLLTATTAVMSSKLPITEKSSVALPVVPDTT